MDFSKFDPFDGWAWTKLKLVLQQLEDEQLQLISDVDFRYYTTMAASKWVSEDSGKLCVEQSAVARNKLIGSYRPWVLPDTTNDVQAARDDIAATHKRLFGSPGEPRYEAMVAALLATTKPKTAAEKATLEVQRKAAAIRAAKGKVG